MAAGEASAPIDVDAGSVKATITRSGDLSLVVLAGVLDERFQSEALTAHVKGRVILELGGIESVTSFGVRGWLAMMTAITPQVDDLYLASCSEAVVNQMLMIRSFAGPGVVVSFYVPYVCTECSETLDFNFNTENISQENGEYVSPPDVACRNCGGKAVFDEDPASFFEFLLNQAEVTTPPEVRELLTDRWLESSGQLEGALEKSVEGRETRVRVNCPIDEKVRWKRVFDGVEGVLRFDFSNSRDATEEGCERFVKVASKTGDSVTEVIFDETPVKLLQALAAQEDTGAIYVRSVSMLVPCSDCELLRPVSATARQVYLADKAGKVPEAKCRRCGSPISLVFSKPVTRFLAAAESGRSGGGIPTKFIVGGLVAVGVVAVAAVVIMSLS